MQHAWIVAGLSAFALTACGGGDAGEPEDTAAAVVSDADNGAQETETHTAEARVTPVPEGSLAADPMILGDADAPVQIIEYASVTCPGCAAFHAVGWPFVEEMLIEPGVANFEYREFPTAPQNLAYAGFYLARCTATENGAKAYYRILETLYARQSDWAFGNNPGEVLANIASQAGIDRTGLEDCFFREDIKTAVAENVKTGVNNGVKSTPSFFVQDETFSWGGSPVALLFKAEQEAVAQGSTGIAVGTTSSITLPFDFCGSILQNTEKALGSDASRGEDGDSKKVVNVRSPAGGVLTATCSKPSDNPETHELTIAKLAAE